MTTSIRSFPTVSGTRSGQNVRIIYTQMAQAWDYSTNECINVREKVHLKDPRRSSPNERTRIHESRKADLEECESEPLDPRGRDMTAPGSITSCELQCLPDWNSSVLTSPAPHTPASLSSTTSRVPAHYDDLYP